MLPRSARLTRSPEFGTAVRTGRRAGGRLLVVHVAAGAAGTPQPRMGLVVSRAVGGAVVRNRVKRRLRHLLRDGGTRVPGSALVVVRALPAAAEASYAELASALERGLERATRSASAPDAADAAVAR